MSADIEFNKRKGTFSMFSRKEVPWHGLGEVVDSALTSSEAIKLANLDYRVLKGQSYVKYPEDLQDRLGKGKKLKNSFITFREDNGVPLGIVGNRYTVVQNESAFNFFDEVVGFKDAIFETAGVLGLGETVFITAKLPKHIKVGGNDIIDRYLLFTNCHDGTRSVEVLFTPIRVVCNNTLRAALHNAKSKYKIRHTASAQDRLDEAKIVLNIENTMAEEVQELYRAMTGVRMTDRQVYGYINSMFLTSTEIEKLDEGLPYDEVLSTRKKNIIGTTQKYYTEGPGQDMDSAKGTLWGAYNAVTGYYANAKAYKDSEAKLQTVVYGDGSKNNNKAFELAKNIVQTPSMLEMFN